MGVAVVIDPGYEAIPIFVLEEVGNIRIIGEAIEVRQITRNPILHVQSLWGICRMRLRPRATRR